MSYLTITMVPYLSNMLMDHPVILCHHGNPEVRAAECSKGMKSARAGWGHHQGHPSNLQYTHQGSHQTLPSIIKEQAVRGVGPWSTISNMRLGHAHVKM